MSTMESVRSALVTAGVIDGTDWAGYIGYMPDDQDQVVGLIPTGGFPQDTHGAENGFPTFQVTVRAGRNEYSTARSKWLDMYHALQDANLSASNIWLIQAYATDPIHMLDGKNRHNFVSNFRVIRAAE
jgi:hypothetical protein